MSLRVVGAGLPRTGTMSLKTTLERLLDGDCYHMHEMQLRTEADAPHWWAALHGKTEHLDQVLDGWVAAIDWPASIFWRELAERHPDALVILSHRGDSATWWKSANATVWEAMRRTIDQETNEAIVEFNRLLREQARFPHDMHDEAAARARYDEHFDEVVSTIPAERLLLWKPTDGWDPICHALGVPVPDEPPIHKNSTAEFVERLNQHRPLD